MILEFCESLAILNLDIFDGNFALISLSIRKRKTITADLAHFKYADRVTVALPIHYLQKVLRLLAGQLLLVRWTNVSLVEIELFRQAVFPVLSTLRLYSDGWCQHGEPLFATWASVLVEAPRDQTGAAEMMIYAGVYARQMFDVLLFEADLADKGVAGLALGEHPAQFGDLLLVYLDVWLKEAAGRLRLLNIDQTVFFSHDREDFGLCPGQHHWLRRFLRADNKCVLLGPPPTLGLVHLLFHLLPQ